MRTKPLNSEKNSQVSCFCYHQRCKQGDGNMAGAEAARRRLVTPLEARTRKGDRMSHDREEAGKEGQTRVQRISRQEKGPSHYPPSKDWTPSST